MLKPLKLTPAYKDYIWGGEKLRTLYGKDTDITPVAESWELSCHKDGPSTIFGGEHHGKTLKEYISENPSVLGTSVEGDELPILIKFIDACDNLSVQVHPNDEQAKLWEGQKGKTEMWYVVDADKDARIIYGLKNDTSREEIESAVKEKRLENLLNSVPSEKGDVFFVEAGTIHAIGRGNLIAEIQQNSNVTYRLYDYGRVSKDGKERELHIEKGVMAATLRKAENKEPVMQDGIKTLAGCKYFEVKEIKLNGAKNLTADEKSYHALVNVGGNIEMTGDDIFLTIRAGETVFVPAGMGEYTLNGEATVLFVSNSAM